MKNNSNQKNIEEIEKTVKFTTRKVMAYCSSETISYIETQALLRLHESKIISQLLSNSETWVLKKEERKKLERIELWSLKKLFGLPQTTPSIAVFLTTGCLFTSQRIDQKQIIYLKTILNRPDYDWTRRNHFIQRSENIWWSKQINELLDNYELDFTWDEIKEMPFAEWKRRVKAKIEQRHVDRLKEGYSGPQGERTKIKFIHDIIEKQTYKREPMACVIKRSKIGAKTLIMGMSGMLDCPANFHFKYKRKTCDVCSVLHDDSHRINYCKKFSYMNLNESELKFDFQKIYSKDRCDVDKAEYVIRQLWDLSNGKNQMKPSLTPVHIGNTVNTI